MLEKNNSVTDKYKVNARITVTVKNTLVTPERGDNYYRTEVTIKYKDDDRERPISFDDYKDVAKFVKGLDFEDPQLSLMTDNLNPGSR